MHVGGTEREVCWSDDGRWTVSEAGDSSSRMFRVTRCDCWAGIAGPNRNVCVLGLCLYQFIYAYRLVFELCSYSLFL